MSERRPAVLVLEDGSFHRGYGFGHPSDGSAEVVFNTSMTGYQEICTDASYRGQMVVMTYPLIGNYGVTGRDRESAVPWVAGLIVREYYEDYSNCYAEGSLGEMLEKAGVPAVSGVDTRALTRRIRTSGTMRGVLLQGERRESPEEMIAMAQAVPSVSQIDAVGDTVGALAGLEYEPGRGEQTPRIVVVDCGIKWNIIRSLLRRAVRPIVVSHMATHEEITALHPAGVVVSNGPGDPANLHAPIATLRSLIDSDLPIFGICLGHQLLGLAIGATTSRLKYGHHGANHPVKDLASGVVSITSQNHEFQVDRDSIPADSGFVVSKTNLNDGSVEGLAHRDRPVFSVQYHPEGSPGPQDNQYLFDHFLEMAGATRSKSDTGNRS